MQRVNCISTCISAIPVLCRLSKFFRLHNNKDYRGTSRSYIYLKETLRKGLCSNGRCLLYIKFFTCYTDLIPSVLTAWAPYSIVRCQRPNQNILTYRIDLAGPNIYTVQSCLVQQTVRFFSLYLKYTSNLYHDNKT